MEIPQVSVIIPTFNRAHLILKAIQSILEQTYPCSEIIVVDDGSADNTHQIVDSINDARLRCIRHPTNKGLAEARNTGLANVKGSYIAFLDSDDFWYKEKIAKQITIFKTYPEADFIFTNGYYRKEGELLFKTAQPSGFISQHKNHFPLKDILPLPSSWLFKREIIERVGDFDKSLSMFEDGDFFIRAARLYRVYFLNEPLVFWFSPQENFNQLKELQCRQLFLERHKSTMSLDKDYYFRFLSTLGKDYLRIGDKKKAQHFFKQALKIKPFSFSGWRKLLKTIA